MSCFLGNSQLLSSNPSMELFSSWLSYINQLRLLPCSLNAPCFQHPVCVLQMSSFISLMIFLRVVLFKLLQPVGSVSFEFLFLIVLVLVFYVVSFPQVSAALTVVFKPVTQRDWKPCVWGMCLKGDWPGKWPLCWGIPSIAMYRPLSGAVWFLQRRVL